MLDISYVKEQGKRFFPITHRKAIVGLASNTLVLSESIDVDVDINTDGEPITINPIVQNALNALNTRCDGIDKTLTIKANSTNADGVADSAHKLETPRKIILDGSVTGEISFDGSNNVTITTTTTHTHLYAGSSTAGGVANSAAKLETPRNIALSGAVTGNINFDGSGNVTIATSVNHTHAASAVTAGTFAGAVYHNQSAANSIGAAQIRNIYGGTGGISSLTTGTVYLQYS